MATSINNTTATTATNSVLDNKPKQSKNAVLGKDDFMKLMLVELQNQDPTQPMDSEKILSQTSQLATLESADNTNKSLAKLASSLTSANQFSTIAAIGKIGDIGSDATTLATDGEAKSFELYFKDAIQSGQVNITDSDGNTIKTLPFKQNASDPTKIDILKKDGTIAQTLAQSTPNVYKFNWDGKNNEGADVTKGLYHVKASALSTKGESMKTKLGAYPIESVRFDASEPSVKVGSSYIPFSKLKEVY